MDWDGMRERWECPACGAIQYDNDDGKYDGDYHREDD
jgi:rubredoxin